MNEAPVCTLEEVRQVLKLTQPLEFRRAELLDKAVPLALKQAKPAHASSALR